MPVTGVIADSGGRGTEGQGRRSIVMAEDRLRSSGWLSFLIACAVYIAGYWLWTGEPPGVEGTLHWWSIIVLVLLWGAASAALEWLKSRRG
jgi:hypothetical protein